MSYPFFKTSQYGEKKNCTVRAFHHAFNIPYEEAHNVLKIIGGRKENKGVNFESFMKALGGMYKKVPFKRHLICRMQIGKFLEVCGKGTYICKIHKHVFAVIDGVVHDSYQESPKRWITDVYTIGSIEKPACLIQSIKTTFKTGVKKSQRTIIIEMYKKGVTSVDKIVAETQIKKTNVQWYFSQLKLKNIAC